MNFYEVQMNFIVLQSKEIFLHILIKLKCCFFYNCWFTVYILLCAYTLTFVNFHIFAQFAYDSCNYIDLDLKCESELALRKVFVCIGWISWLKWWSRWNVIFMNFLFFLRYKYFVLQHSLRQRQYVLFAHNKPDSALQEPWKGPQCKLIFPYLCRFCVCVKKLS